MRIMSTTATYAQTLSSTAVSAPTATLDGKSYGVDNAAACPLPNKKCTNFAEGITKIVRDGASPAILWTVQKWLYCEFNPPTVDDVLAMRTRFSISLRHSMKEPPFERCAAFEIHTARPGKVAPIARDGHCGYRTLAYLIFFNEEAYMDVRRLVANFVLENASAFWATSK